MRLLRFLYQHPLTLLGVIAFAFIGWVWWDAIPTRNPAPDVPSVKGLHDANGPMRKPLPAPPPLAEDPSPPVDATNGLAKLKPGMPRAEVEKLVGSPADNHVYPATIANGRVTYQAAYEADFGPPPTVRPINTSRPPRAGREPVPAVREPAGRALVTLEFDATKPGHPLLGIHYPDPLF